MTLNNRPELAGASASTGASADNYSSNRSAMNPTEIGQEWLEYDRNLTDLFTGAWAKGTSVESFVEQCRSTLVPKYFSSTDVPGLKDYATAKQQGGMEITNMLTMWEKWTARSFRRPEPQLPTSSSELEQWKRELLIDGFLTIAGLKEGERLDRVFSNSDSKSDSGEQCSNHSVPQTYDDSFQSNHQFSDGDESTRR